MALIDPQRDVVVIRIVYDGPPMAGKTTSVRALANGLGGKVIIPEEVGGRTVFFDWLDYTGGLFEGRQIRCQIISVPGQATLASRRRHLLESADVVVFVGDSRREHLSTSRQYLAGLDSVLKRIPGPPVGVVMQANKRDHADAAELSEIQQLLDHSSLDMAIIESVATEGHGIRESFVFAVRLALDRVKELLKSGELVRSTPSVDSPDDLMNELSRIEGGSLDLALESGLKHTTLGEIHSRPVVADAVESVLQSQVLKQATLRSRDSISEPAVPGEEIPSGMIWPPVTGRLVLHESLGHLLKLQKDAQGNWRAPLGARWFLHSHANARYENLDAGRAALVEWARLHVTCMPHLSPRRCIVLSDDGSGAYRLWQITGVETSLRDRLRSSLGKEPGSIASALAHSAEHMMRAAEAWSDAPLRIPLSLRTTGTSFENPTYTGRMPDPRDITPATVRSERQVLRIMSSELAFALPELTASRDAILCQLDSLTAESARPGASLASRLIRQMVGAD